MHAILEAPKKGMPADSPLTPEQTKIYARVADHLRTHPASAEQLTAFFLKNGFGEDRTKVLVGQLLATAPKTTPRAAGAEADPNEIIKRYFALLYSRFVSDPLFIYETEAIARSKDTTDTRLGLFIDHIPYFIPLEQPQHALILLNPKVRALYLQQLSKLFIEPVRRVFQNPGLLSLKKFVMMTGLKGQPFVDVTTQMEDEGWADMDLKRDEIRFQVKKITAARQNFRQFLGLLKGAFPEGEATIDKILLAFDSTVSVPDNQPANKPFQRMITKSIPFTLLDLKAAKEGLRPETFGAAFYEALLLLNHFRRSENAKQTSGLEGFVTYADGLTAQIRGFAEKGTLTPFQSKQVTRIFACLSMMQGKSLMLINEYYKSRNALEYDQMVSLMKKVY